MTDGILCIGAAHWDLIARTDAPLPFGADVPGRIHRRPGGVAANIALASASLGNQAMLVAAIGLDVPGDDLVDLLKASSVGTTGLVRHNGRTDTYIAIENRFGDLHAAVADCTGLEHAGLSLLMALGGSGLPPPWPGRVVADGNLPPPVIEALARAPSLAAAPFAVVPASPSKAAGLGTVLPALARVRPLTLYLNRREAEALCAKHFSCSREAAAALRARRFAEVVVTDGGAPATAADAESAVTLAPPVVASRSTTGAGDTMVAAHLAARSDGLNTAAALETALAASARYISRATTP